LYLLGEGGLIAAQPKHPYYAIRSLSRSYTYFLDKIPTKVSDLIKLLEKINQLMFVQITVGSQADAFMLYESLNNRGVPLSAMDIIKNKMLAQLEKKHNVDINVSFERWRGIVESIPDAKDQERFLRHFYNAFKHRDEIKVEKIPRATRSSIIRIYETLINKNAAQLFDHFCKGAMTYGKLLIADFGPIEVRSHLTELERIGSAAVYQLLLYLFSLQSEHFEEPNLLAGITDLMKQYFIRRNVTEKSPHAPN
jgi:uncharacterized protein with ParB-like and HNH nuclease domain